MGFGIDVENNSEINPLFTNAEAGNFTLTAASPAIDGGLQIPFANAATSKDIAGNPRITGISIDLGAYENTAPVLYTPDSAGIMYVVKGASGTGASWNNAVGELAVALKKAQVLNANTPGKVTQIWVAKGTYKPMYRANALNSANTSDLNNTFLLQSGVAVYGHFAGTETAISQRNLGLAENKTILTGDLNGDDEYIDEKLFGNTGDNAYHVVMCAGAGTPQLDGFTIKGGNSVNDNVVHTVNGITNVKRNQGGGIYITGSQPVLSNVILSGNRGYNSAAIFNESSASVFKNLLITGNISTMGCAGITHIGSGVEIKLINSTITKNSGAKNTVGMMVSGGTLRAYNSIMWGNTASNGVQSVTQIFHYNNTVEGATAVGYWNALTHGSNVSNSSTADDPLFTNPDSNIFTLQHASPARDAGNSIYYTDASSATDLAGNPRVYGTTIDKGAYEKQAIVITPDVNGRIYVVKGAAGEGKSWENAAGEMADALKAANNFRLVP